MPIRDDSAGSYGTWNNDNLGWLDWLKANASDGGNALSNLGRNLVDGFSPIGTSEQGNMSLQVPPIVSGIADSYGRLAGTPNNPGNAYNLSGVPELDAPIQQDMSNVLLSLYGGNAVSGLARGGAAAAGAYSPSLLDRGMSSYKNLRYGSEPTAFATMPAEMLGHVDRTNSNTRLAGTPANADLAGNQIERALAHQNYDPLFSRFPDVANRMDNTPVAGGPEYLNAVYAQNARDQFRIIDGDLLSDTGRPSILGGALATAGESNASALGPGLRPNSKPEWLRF